MRLLVRNIGRIVGIEREGRLRLCGAEMDRMETLGDAWLLADGGRIAAFGRSGGEEGIAADRVVDAGGGMLFPSFCDSHTHLVYAGSREQEFLDKINGLSYEEIARRGGGILNSADRLHETSEEELFRQAMERVREIAVMGTGAVEIKSGYGLSTEDELKMLRVVRRIRQETPLEVRATFLGAHAVARAYRGRQGEYVDLVCREMLPAVAREGLADFAPATDCGRRSMPTSWPSRAACRRACVAVRCRWTTSNASAPRRSERCAGRRPCPRCCPGPRSSWAWTIPRRAR